MSTPLSKECSYGRPVYDPGLCRRVSCLLDIFFNTTETPDPVEPVLGVSEGTSPRKSFLRVCGNWLNERLGVSWRNGVLKQKAAVLHDILLTDLEGGEQPNAATRTTRVT